MILLDTHVWIWWVNGDSRLSPTALDQIEPADALGISVISCWEFSMLVDRGRVHSDVPVEQWVDDALALPGVELLPITASIAVHAGSSRLQMHGDPADRIIVATALEHDLQVVTKDRKLRDLPFLTTIW